MHVIGTAGHVDHGKSTLTQALTGINPDRLIEEQRREMTIDLGFAWLDLPNGERVGIIDVPGHRDFIENMLAGVGGIDAAILVIAADEGIMPQTREHLAILDLLAVPTGLIALTKIDLITDPDWLDLVQLDILDAVQGTLLEGKPILPVSARTGEGLDQLLASITEMLEHQPTRPNRGPPRLPIDRVFTVGGFGVVVTGTLRDGSLTVGQSVEVQPGGLQARIRGLQSHEQSLASVEPGQRVAVNLRNLEKSDLARGQVLGLPGLWQPATLLDAWLRYLPDARLPLDHDDPIKLFIGTAEVMGHVRILDRERVSPGDQSWIQLRLDDPVVATYGDHFILRRASPPETIGGGIILDPAPGRRWKRFRSDVIERFETLYQGDPMQTALLFLSQQQAPLRRAAVTLTPAQLDQAVAAGDLILLADWGFQLELWSRLLDQTIRLLTAFHTAEPLRAGMPPESLRGQLRLDPEVLDLFLQELARQQHLVLENGVVRLPHHTIRLSSAQEDQLRRLKRDFEQSPYTPPTFSQARDIVGDALLNYLLEQGELVRISTEVLLAPSVLREWIDFSRHQLDQGAPLTVAALRDHFQTTRRYALDFLERLDALNITRRKGDERLRGSADWSKIGYS